VRQIFKIERRAFARTAPPRSGGERPPGRQTANSSLKSVAARLAFPHMPHATLIDVFGPFGHDQALAAFGASDDRAVRGAKVHVHGPSHFCLVYVGSKKLFMFAVKQKSVEADRDGQRGR